MQISLFNTMISTALLTIFLSVPASADDYCDGFEQGYKDGYRQAVRSSLDPMVPLCTLQPITELDQPERNYHKGYVLGKKEGYEKGKEAH